MKSSIRLRFAFGTAVFLLLTMVVFGTGIFASVARTLFSELDESLRVTASEAIAAMNIESGRMNLSDGSLAEIAAAHKDRGFALRVIDISTHRVISFGNLPMLSSRARTEMLAHPDVKRHFNANGEGGSALRIYTSPIVEKGTTIGILQVALPTLSVWTTLDRLLVTLAISVPILALLAALGGYFLARSALHPIEELTRAARNLTVDNLRVRLSGSTRNDEIGQLAATFDEMTDRLHHSFQRERQFTSDVSHELRTPLTALEAILHYLLERERKPEENRQALQDMSAEVSRLRNLTQQMLALVRTEQSENRAKETVDLSSMLQGVLDSSSSAVFAKGLELRHSIQDGLYVNAIEDDIVRLFLNLIDNAIKFTESGSIAVCASRNGAGTIRVTVSDTGIGIPAEALPHLFDRFYRSERSRSVPGSGLGLSIAQGIARNHGGQIAVESGIEGGAVFRVDLPATDA